MGRQNIYSILSVSSAMPPSMLSDLVDFIVTNRQYILPYEKRDDMFKARFSGHTPISEIYHKLVSLSKDQSYGLLLLPSKTASIREVIDMTFVPFDFLQIKEMIPTHTKTLSAISELNDKMIINITDITRANGEFSDITQFQWHVVRDFLSRSFYNSTGNYWISPTLIRYVAKVYSMTIGGQITRMFGLSPLVQMFIQTIFCMYFVSRMTTTENTPAFIKTHTKYLGIVDSNDLTQILSFVEDTLDKKSPETLEDVFKVIDAYGHDQIKGPHGSRLNRAVLNLKFSSLFQEGHVSAIALEYPPYFLFLILLVLSGTRIGLSFHMKNMNLIKEGKDVMDHIIKSPLLTSGV